MENEKSLDQIREEIRSMIDENVRSSFDTYSAKMEQEMATYRAGNPSFAKDGGVNRAYYKDMAERMIKEVAGERRTLSINSTGNVEVVQDIVEAMRPTNKITGRFQYFYGPAAGTTIPILSANPAVPAGQSEGATGISDDPTGALAAVQLLPKDYISILPVSAEALAFTPRLADKIPSIMAKAFAEAVYAGAVAGGGTGNDFSGFMLAAQLSNSVTCTTSGTVTLMDFANLALTVKDYSDNMVIVTNGTNLSKLLLETTAESAPIKASLLSTGTLFGVPVVASSKAPTALTTGAVVAVAMDMENYGVAIANSLTIDAIKVKGSTATWFQASMFMNGKVINAANGWKLLGK